MYVKGDLLPASNDVSDVDAFAFAQLCQNLRPHRVGSNFADQRRARAQARSSDEGVRTVPTTHDFER